MKYVALLSGGKDSCFNLVHCQKNGHELVAAASLGPEPGKEELDSFLYQTVGQDVIHLVARALDIPLYRRVITGSAAEQGIEYGARVKTNKEASGVPGDETEDLYELLASAKLAHPDVQGVSVGAILSNYQRVRVEHVCSRLGLTPLAYLWQRDQAELLNEMIEVGMEAILIKVAGIGLTSQHLGMSLAQMQPHLTKLNSLYGSHICGEGGEYESLTLDCPVFKQRIQLKDVETVIHSDNAFATVAYLRIRDAELSQKDKLTTNEVVVPSLLEEENLFVQEALEEISERDGLMLSGGETQQSVKQDVNCSSSRLGNWVSVCNVQRQLSSPHEEISLEDEVTECFSILQEHLEKYHLNFSNCININIFISSMDLFACLNAVYGTYFGTSPPSRACIAVDLPKPVRLRLDCTAFAEPDIPARQALHVQGLSYWAPANIGPYSQAILAEERITISGQIGLIPSSLVLPSPPSFPAEFALSSQHVDRVVRALRGGWEGIIQSATYFVDDVKNLALAKEGHKLLKLPDSPSVFVSVKTLPRNALVEKQVLLHTGRRRGRGEDGEVEVQTQEAILHRSGPTGGDLQTYFETLKFQDGTLLCSILFGRGQDESQVKFSLFTGSKHGRILSAQLFCRLPVLPFLSGVVVDCSFPITIVPCRAISSINDDGWDYAIHLTGIDHSTVEG